jgi:hypothetical protein
MPRPERPCGRAQPTSRPSGSAPRHDEGAASVGQAGVSGPGPDCRRDDVQASPASARTLSLCADVASALGAADDALGARRGCRTNQSENRAVNWSRGNSGRIGRNGRLQWDETVNETPKFGLTSHRCTRSRFLHLCATASVHCASRKGGRAAGDRASMRLTSSSGRWECSNWLRHYGDDRRQAASRPWIRRLPRTVGQLEAVPLGHPPRPRDRGPPAAAQP